jgi:hypothetical protein
MLVFNTGFMIASKFYAAADAASLFTRLFPSATRDVRWAAWRLVAW